MTRLLLFAFLFAMPVEAIGQASDPPAKAEEKKKKKKKKRKKKKEAQPPPEAAPPPVEAPPPPKEPIRTVITPAAAEEEMRVEAAQKKLEAERRKDSKITPGTVSRWSNKGAMLPVESAVPILAPLPERAKPIAAGVTTPGQALLDANDDLLSMRLSFGGYHLQTSGQDQIYLQGDEVADNTTPALRGGTRNIDLLRARATMGYQNIAGSDFGVKLDAEYRPRLNGARFTDWRINELYASYGLTEFKSVDAPFFGVALGRLAIREAGYAQADGLAARFRIVDWLRVGLFGGVTGNPYGYNWNQRNTEVVSIDWITGGLFVSLEIPELIVNVSGVVTFANINPLLSDLDRLYLYVDAAYLILPELNVVVNGWLDMLPGGQIVQNLDATINWTPDWEPLRGLSLSVGGGRFTTVIYELSTGYSYVANGTNLYDPTRGPVIGDDGTPVVPFDAVQMTTIYNNARFRAGYRILRDLDVTAKVDYLNRDASAHQGVLQAVAMNTVKPSPHRTLPGGGIRYHNPDIVDAHIGYTAIIDEESQANHAIDFGLGRGLFGAYLGADGRYYAGDISAFDGGFTLSYMFPRDWFPGTLILRGQFRYFRENITILEPIPGNNMITRNAENPQLIDGFVPDANQDSILAFGGIEWRL
jgi:hypothetical protein